MDTATLALLSKSFPDRVPATAYAFERQGTIVLSDRRSCKTIPAKPSCPADCNEEVLIIESDSPLTIVEYDEWSRNDPESKCDYIIFDSGNEKKRFALCELTCSDGKYVEFHNGRQNIGKRAKAQSQMFSAWNSIREAVNPVIGVQILQYCEKTGIFGWREPEVKAKANNGAMQSMLGFLSTPSSATTTEYEQYAFGEVFRFIQVKYPSPYKW